MLGSKEIGTLIQALGTSIGHEEFNLEKLRYHKIVIMTDADVDGAHIRTLLLTFFYRQMPELIDKGHLFIAQPPLYKVARGRSEVYLKDDAALDDYLEEAGLEGLVLDAPGGQRSGNDLKSLVDHARRMRTLMAYAPRNYDPALIEALAINGALKPNIDAPSKAKAAQKVAEWLGAGEGEQPTEADTKGKPVPVTRPSELLDAVLAAGRKGLSVQRYKGLGEMNAEQLWETTLDPSNRSLLRVEVAQADVADEIFTRPMGDVVEPRREFIQDNALSVANLDV